MMQDFTVGAQIDALIEELEGAYDDLEASANRMDDLTDQLELAKKRVQEDSAKVAQLRGRLEERYPRLKGLAWDYMLATAKGYRGGGGMTYDDWKTETPEDEEERINGPARRRAARLEWQEDHADELLEMRREDEAFWRAEGNCDE